MKKFYVESMPKNNSKNIVVCNFPRFSSEIWFPYLWLQAKSYYEQFGQRQDEWHWCPSYVDFYDQQHIDDIKQQILKDNPTILAFSLYVWNFELSMEIAQWAKKTLPGCLIITGGPHQFEKHDPNWFKDHWYIDASLPSDCYGELCFQEILDNYNNGKVKWNNVSDIKYPFGKDRVALSSPKTLAKADRSKFYFDYSIFSMRQADLDDFVREKSLRFPKSIMLTVLETTRGCPYGCTYCDWGGGIKTKVIKKSLESVQADIDTLFNYKLAYIYLSDANFGIFGERDVDILKYFVQVKKANNSRAQIGYGGLAKTANKLEYLKEIVKLDVENKLGNQQDIKLSIQTLDKDILKNIDRESIDFNLQIESFGPLANTGKIPMYAEIIMGLPGMKLSKYYYELDVFGEHRLPVQWYAWILLPEAPSFSKQYRDQYKIKTVLKSNGWHVKEDTFHAEIVVSAEGYSTDDYLTMLLSSSLYTAFIQGRFLKNTIEYLQSQNVKLGMLCQSIIGNFDYGFDQVYSDWQQIMDDYSKACYFNVAGNSVPVLHYFAAKAFYQHSDFTVNLTLWLKHKYSIPDSIINQDLMLAINQERFGRVIRHGLTWVDYRKNKAPATFDSIINIFRGFEHSTSIMQGSKKFLNLI